MAGKGGEDAGGQAATEGLEPESNGSQSRDEMQVGNAFSQITGVNPGLASLLPLAAPVPAESIELSTKVCHTTFTASGAQESSITSA